MNLTCTGKLNHEIFWYMKSNSVVMKRACWLAVHFFLGGGSMLLLLFIISFWWESLQMNQTDKGMKTNFILFRGQKWMQNDGINEKRIFHVSRFKVSGELFPSAIRPWKRGRNTKAVKTLHQSFAWCWDTASSIFISVFSKSPYPIPIHELLLFISCYYILG